jgi:hypothetical protein
MSFGRAAPYRYAARDAVLSLEATHVLAHRLGEHHLATCGLDVLSAQALDVLGEEHRRHRPDRTQLVLHGVEVIAREHIGGARGGIRVVREQVPAAEHELVELRQRHELADERLTLLVASAQADSTQLGQ